jgi:hypothetical protein
MVCRAYSRVTQTLKCAKVGLAHRFRERHGAILIGMRPAGRVNSGAILNPAFNAVVEGGMFLDYISKHPVEIEWVDAQSSGLQQ